MQPWYEHEEDLLVDELNAGKITQKEFDSAMHDIASERKAMMEKTCKPNGVEMRHIYGCAEYLK